MALVSVKAVGCELDGDVAAWAEAIVADAMAGAAGAVGLVVTSDLATVIAAVDAKLDLANLVLSQGAATARGPDGHVTIALHHLRLGDTQDCVKHILLHEAQHAVAFLHGGASAVDAFARRNLSFASKAGVLCKLAGKIVDEARAERATVVHLGPSPDEHPNRSFLHAAQTLNSVHDDPSDALYSLAIARLADTAGYQIGEFLATSGLKGSPGTGWATDWVQEAAPLIADLPAPDTTLSDTQCDVIVDAVAASLEVVLAGQGLVLSEENGGVSISWNFQV